MHYKKFKPNSNVRVGENFEPFIIYSTPKKDVVNIEQEFRQVVNEKLLIHASKLILCTGLLF